MAHWEDKLNPLATVRQEGIRLPERVSPESMELEQMRQLDRTLGLVRSRDNTFVIDPDLYSILMGATDFTTGVGIAIGLLATGGTEWGFRVGDPAGNRITWDETNGLTVVGGATIDSGTIGGWTVAAGNLSSGSVTLDAANENIRMGSATAYMTGEGIWLGSDGSGGYDFRVGDPAGDYILWDASTGSFTIKAENFTGETPTFTGYVTVKAGLGNPLVVLYGIAGPPDYGALVVYDTSEFQAIGTKYMPSRIEQSFFLSGFQFIVTDDLLIDNFGSGELTLGMTMLPSADSTYDIGSTTELFANIYGDIIWGGAVHVGAGAVGNPPSGWCRLYWNQSLTKLYVLDSGGTSHEVAFV